MSSNELIQADGTSISCHVDEIPSWVDDGLSSLYGTLHSSLPFFRVFRSTEGVSCYAARRDGRPVAILLFTRQGRRLDVLNEMIEIDQVELHRFANYVFATFPAVDLIGFKAVKTAAGRFGFPVQQHHSKGTYVITLPATAEQYTASLGKSTRAGVRQQTNLVNRTFPTFTTHYYMDKDIDEEHIKAILKFSEDRIGVQGVKLAHDLDRILALSRVCGYLVVHSIDGRICAGSVNYRVGTSYFGDVTGYDMQYERYGLGKICVHQTICGSIERGGTKFYLGGGDFDFKQRFLGVALDMDELRIYRSHLKMLVNLDRVAQVLVDNGIRSLKKLLHRHKQKLLGRLAFKFFYALKNRAAN